MTQYDKAPKVLKILLDGGRIETGGQTYVMSDRFEICIVGKTDSGEERYLPVMGMGVPELILWTEGIPSEDVLKSVFGNVLYQHKARLRKI